STCSSLAMSLPASAGLSGRGMRVTRTGLSPVASAIQTSMKLLPSSFHRNATRLLSGDHAGFAGAVPVTQGRLYSRSMVMVRDAAVLAFAWSPALAGHASMRPQNITQANGNRYRKFMVSVDPEEGTVEVVRRGQRRQAGCDERWQ